MDTSPENKASGLGSKGCKVAGFRVQGLRFSVQGLRSMHKG